MMARRHSGRRLDRRRRLRTSTPFAVALALAAGAAACGSDESAGGTDGGHAALSDDARRGRDVAQENGCAGCHREGGGGIGPDWEGLYGSTVTLDDGSTVVADEEYLALAITDPDAQVVDGYDVRMPPRDMSDDDVANVVAYIRELDDEPTP